jgi:hypothetical protein
MRALAAIVVLASAAGAPALAEEPRFGQQGEVVPLGSLSFSYSSVAPDLGSVTTLSLGPTLLWFVADDIALGGSATLVRRTVSQGDSSATISSYGVAPTAAYNLRLSPRASLLPQVAVAFGWQEFTTSPSGNNPSLSTISLQLFVPILFHPVPHFFLGFGPAFSYDVSASLSDAAGDAPKSTTIGAQTILGGWF